MKSRILVSATFFALVLSSLKSSAQATQIESTINVCHCELYIGSLFQPADPKISIGGSIGATSRFGTNGLLMAQLQYSRDGGKQTLTYDDGTGVFWASFVRYYRFNTLSLPVTMGVIFGQRVRFTIAGGVYAGVVLNARYVTEDPAFTSSKIGVKRLNYGLTANVNAYVPVSEKFSIKIGIQENYGLANLSPSGKEDVALKLRSTNFQLGLTMKVR